MKLEVRSFSGHKGSVTSVAISSDNTTVLSVSKDNSLISWDTESGKRTYLKNRWSNAESTQSHEGELLAVAAASGDAKYVACGGRDNKIRIYDIRQKAEVKVFQGHRGAITSLVFRKGTNILFSGSEDRCIKQWDLNEMGYLDTLFGHQEPISALDCWTKDEPISASSDRTVRLFKVAQESHLVFRGHGSAVDAVQVLTDSSYISGGQDGSLRLWRETNKKAVSTVQAAHGSEGTNPNWIVSLAALKMTDLAFSGSNDGYLRLWLANAGAQQLSPVAAVPLSGFVNSLAVSPELLVAGTGCEHRLGRWWNIRGSNNKVHIIRLPSAAESSGV